MNNSPQISVIIPIFNAERYLEKCLDSVIAQTFKDIEIICIDDCSTDNSKEILNNFARKDSRIKAIFFDKNKKQGAARNAGLDIARGKYITFIDADDYVEETLLEKMYKKAERNFCDLVITSVENIVLDKDNKNLMSLKDRLNYKATELNTGFYCFDQYFKILRLGPVAKLYKRSIIEKYKIRFPENLIHEDVAFYWFYMPYVSNFYYINEYLYYRIINSSSVMYKLHNEDKGLFDHIEIVKLIHDYLKNNKLYDLYNERFLSYVKGIVESKEYKKIKKQFLIKTALFMPDVLVVLLDDFRILKQIILNKHKRLAFWGASLFLEAFIQKYNIRDKNIVGIIDNDSRKWGKQLGGFTIYPPAQIKELNVQSVICTIKHNDAYTQIKEYIEENLPDVNLLKNAFSVESKHKQTVPLLRLERFSIHLAEHCNLNCKGCNNFSPLAEKKFADIKTYERDIKRIAELTDNELKRVYLIGGEPLLHPDLIKFLRLSRLNLPNTRIIILTNGILLPTQKEEFWRACNKYNIAIEVTKYPINIDFNKIEHLAEKYDVEYGYFCNTGQVNKTSNLYLLDPAGRQNKSSSFKHCECANRCIFLKDGRLYTCAIAPNIEHFNKYFGYNIPLTHQDGIDIHKAKSEKEILKFLASPIPFCKYCDVKRRIYGECWEISKKDIHEWV